MPTSPAASMPAPAVPLFLPGKAGNLFALYHPPARLSDGTGGVVYVHPFAEEMNRSRRIVATQSRALAQCGWGVLQVDLYGCGDSAGEFRDARWEIWLEDLTVAVGWLRDRIRGPMSLWGLRIGGLLAMDFARRGWVPLDRIVLWQPIVSGESVMTQFLRLYSLSNQPGANKTPGELRAMMATGKTIEIAGYELRTELASVIDRIQIAPLRADVNASVHWIEIVSESGSIGRPAIQSIVNEWERGGNPATLQTVVGEPFWSYLGSIAPPKLIDTTRWAFGVAV